jgi:hypothetical protein
MREDPRLLSKPVGVEWAGWTTDTFTLQRRGWQLAVDYQLYDQTYVLMMRHPDMNLTAITDRARLPLSNYFRDEYLLDNKSPVFRVVRVAPTFQFVQLTGYDFRAFKAIDATPQYTDERLTNIDDTNVFAPFRVKTEEVLIDKADMSVVEHLEAIKRLQDPAQAEIRKRMLEAEAAPKRNVVIQLVEYRKHG